MAISIDTPIQYLKGVGPKLGDTLRKRGIHTVGELLEWFPRTYEDRRVARSISSLQPGDIVSLVAHVVSVRSVQMGRSHRKMYEIVVSDSTGRIGCKYFRVPYKGYFERFQPHQRVRVAGKVTHYRSRIEFHHPDVHPVSEDEATEDILVPLYTETEGLSPAKLRKIIETAISELIDAPPPDKSRTDTEAEAKPFIPDCIPQWVQEKYRLSPRARALREIHCPPTTAADQFLKFQAPSQRRIIFEEFFWLELLLASRKQGVRKDKAPVMNKQTDLVSRLLTQLPFELTQAQKRAYQEIVKDMTLPYPMHRMVQGDVGSGKTLVALMAAAHAAGNDHQSAIMVPTEILAEQHYKNARQFFEPLGLKVGLLTGHMKTKERQQVLAQVQSGELHLCVGTHALIQDEVEFKNLGFVIIDEQHRFGVDQRNRLKKKGYGPHFLVMTATPIPRTLAMTVYGDLDVTVIDELPAGRSPVVTRKTFESKRPKVMQFLCDQLKKGRQAYIVYPLVEESDKMELKNAVSEFERLQKEMSDFRLGLLHGKMKSDEKESVMRDFRDRKIDVLVSTTVIEVGVDVPNANLMIIEHAERFGLSQLHQLRGRVGRGQHKSYCVLMLGYAVSDEGRVRAEIMEQTTDGFKIAEADLELRGPGEFLGTRQSGLPGFKMANLVRDVQVLQDARQAAFEILRKDPDLRQPEHSRLQEQLIRSQDHIVG